MDGLNILVTVIIAVFLITVLTLLAQLVYVLWRRRVFRLRSDQVDSTSSKEQMLYFFCWKNPPRIEPAGNHTISSSEDLESSVDDEDVAKWQEESYGPSRALFTIKEEERELETESETENDAKSIKTARSEAGSISTRDEVLGNMESTIDEATPFSTPCASPPYYTPSPSPAHDKYSPGNGDGP